MPIPPRAVFTLVVALAAAGCLDTGDTTSASSSPVDAGSGGVIRIYVRGDLTPRTFSDGLAGQTPRGYVMGLARFDLLRTADDPHPVVVFDHGAAPVDVDMLGETLVGAVPTGVLPAGDYAYGRIRLTKTRFTVDATVHAGALSLPGNLTVTGALSDTIIDGTSWPKGKGTYRFQAGGVDVSQAITLPPYPSTAGGKVTEDAEGTWMTFPFTPALHVGDNGASHRATMIYQVYESFRWLDQSSPGYAAGVLDADANTTTIEPVEVFGATGYSVAID